jgi:pseudaminic acid cytidylyltransferase
MNIAVIPARGGSKRIPRKNVKEFAGKPMIAYAITVARQSGLFDHVIVSTDDQQIVETAKVWGAEIPFIRPQKLADDHTTTVPVIAHAITEIRKKGWIADYVCCIYPAVPFLKANDLELSLLQVKQGLAEFSFAVTEFPSAIQRALKLETQGRSWPFYPEYELIRTQDLEPAYYDAGQFYWGSAEAWLKNPKLHSQGFGHILPNWRVIDIDTPDDWKRAELMYQMLAYK